MVLFKLEAYFFDVSAHGKLNFKVRGLLIELAPHDIVICTLDDQVF